MAEDTKNRILETALSRRSWMSTSTASSPEWKKNVKSREHGKSFYGRRGHYGRYHLHHQHREHRALCTAAFARDRTACVLRRRGGGVYLRGCGGHLYGLDHGRFRQGLCRGGAAAKIVTMELARLFMR